jgi:spore germination cell wall hydrolase CwlJ-like protein
MLDDLSIRVAAATMRMEAEGEGDLGMELVAWVIRNRVSRPGWPNSIVGVVFDDYDFSAWNSDSKKRGRYLENNSPAHHLAASIFVRVWYADSEGDATAGADHYFNPELASPSWAPTMRETLRYKNHVFLDSRRGPA